MESCAIYSALENCTTKSTLMWAKHIYQRISEGTRDSHTFVHDLQHSQLGKPCRGLQIIDTWMGFLFPFCNVVMYPFTHISVINFTEILLKGLISWKQPFYALFSESGFCLHISVNQAQTCATYTSRTLNTINLVHWFIEDLYEDNSYVLAGQ